MEKIGRLLICGTEINDQMVVQQIRSADLVIAREEISSRWLETLHIHGFQRFTINNNQSIDVWASELVTKLPVKSSIAYVTPFTPILSDQVGSTLIKLSAGDNIHVTAGYDHTTELYPSLSANRSSSVLILDGLMLKEKHHPPFSADNTVMIYVPGGPQDYKSIQALLERILPGEHAIFAYYPNPNDKFSWHQIPLKTMNDIQQPVSILVIPQASMDGSLESFQEIIAHLRAPEDGCPWDKKQTHASLRTYLLEETYEALDALDKNNLPSLREELGDILLQILLHAEIATEIGEFSMLDVIEGINRKIIFRHPHVFKDWMVNDEKDVLQNWEALKTKERLENGDETKKGMLDGVPNSYPALAQAQAIQDRAARVGFDWPEITPVLDKVLEELEEVRSAPNDTERNKELGDLLFAIVNLIRWYKLDAESALRLTNQKFRKRFAFIEDQAHLKGQEMSKMTLAEMNALWEQAKAFDD